MTMHRDYLTRDTSQDDWSQALLTIATSAAMAVIAMWYIGL
jgi:hypothetical protein